MLASFRALPCIARNAGWVVTALGLAWLAPQSLMVALRDGEFAALVHESHRPLIVVALSVAAAVVGALLLYTRESPVDRRLTRVALAVPALAVAAGVLAGWSGDVPYMGYGFMRYFCQPVVGPLALLLAFDALRRPAMPAVAFTTQVGVAALALTLTGVLLPSRLAPAWTYCFRGPPSVFESLGVTAAGYDVRVLVTVTSAVPVAGAVCVRRLHHGCVGGSQQARPCRLVCCAKGCGSGGW